MVRTGEKVNVESYIKGGFWAFVWLGACLFSFRSVVFSGFDQLPSDQLDGRFIVGLYEHWFKFFGGNSSWLDLGMFYPVENSLGFSATFFLHSLSYSVFRLLGFDIYHSAILNLIALSFVGFSGFWILSRRVFAFGFGLSVCLAGFFVILAPVNVGSLYSHLQMYSVWYLPWLCVGAHKVVRGYIKREKNRSVWLAIVLCGFVGVLYNSFYIPWFFAIYVFCFGLLLFGFEFAAKDERLFRLKAFGRFVSQGVLREWSFWCAVVICVVCFVPFFVTYLPVLRSSGGHDYSIIHSSLPAWDNFINVTGFSVLWGWLGETGLFPNVAVGKAYGLPVLSAVVTVLASVYSVFFYKGEGHGVRSRQFVLALVFSVIVFWLFALDFGGFSLWKYVYETVPGASAIRVVARFNTVLCLPILLVCGLAVERILVFRKWNRIAKVLGAAGVLALIADQLLITPDRGEWEFSRSKMNAWASEVGGAPDDIETFFVVPYDEAGGGFGMRAQLDAWAIAQKRGLATINGFSGILPYSFELLDSYRMRSPSGYFYRVRDWLSRRDVHGPVGKLDLNNGSWERFDSVSGLSRFPVLVLGDTLEFGRDRFSRNSCDLYDVMEYGWSWPEGGATWTDWSEAGLSFELESAEDQDNYRLEFFAAAYFGAHVVEQSFTVFLNEKELGSFSIAPSMQWSWVGVDVPAFPRRGRLWRIRIECNDATAPSSVSDNKDSRLLGMMLQQFRVRINSSL